MLFKDSDVFLFLFLHLNNVSVWKITPSILSFGRKIELHKISKVCVSNATLLLIKLSPYQVGKASHLFSSSPVPSTLDKLCYFILIIAPRGRNHYPHFMEEETESQRGKMICKSSKCKAGTWTCIWHLSTLLPWVKEKEMCVVKMQMAMTIWKDSSANF